MIVTWFWMEFMKMFCGSIITTQWCGKLWAYIKPNWFPGIHSLIILYHLEFCFEICLKVKCLNNLGVYDLLHQYIMNTHHMSLYGKKIIYVLQFSLQVKSHSYFSIFPFISIFAPCCNYCTSYSISSSETKHWVAKVISEVYLVLVVLCLE